MTSPSHTESESGAAVELDPIRRKRRIVVRRKRETKSDADVGREDASAIADRADRAGTSGLEAFPPRRAIDKGVVTNRGTPRRVDRKARAELEELQKGRRSFLRKAGIGAGLLALGATLGYGSSIAQATGLSGNTRTVVTDTEVAARVIAGVRIATEFIPDPVPAGTDIDPYPGSAIQAALNDGLAVYIPSGTWKLTSAISRPADGVTIMGAGKSTKLLFDGISPCISARAQGGWLIADLATDAGGVNIALSSQTRLTDVWVNGVLTDNRPVSPAGVGLSGYYGARAADYVTSGDGSVGNPWNASAIESAINALPANGGTVFVKAGSWSGNRIALGGTGQAGRGKHIIIRGEGAEISWFNTGLVATLIRCGFDINTGGCLVDFHDCVLFPQTDNTSILKYVYNASDTYWGNWRSIGGFEIRNVKFVAGHPAVWVTGQNVSGFDSTQHWGCLIERCHFRGGGTAIKMEDANLTNYNGIFRGDIRNIVIQANGFGAARAIDINVANLKGVWSNWLVEDSGGSPTAPADYTIYIRTARAGPGLILESIDTGDGCNGTKDAYFESSIEGMTVRSFWFGGLGGTKSVDLNGYGDFELGKYWAGTGTVNVLAAGPTGGIVLRRRQGMSLPLGTINNPENVLIWRSPKTSSEGDHIASSTPTGSPYTYVNRDSVLECVYLVGGVITDVSRNGLSLGPSTAVHYLAPGQSIVVTYTAAPTIRRYMVS